ncbi:major facilitator superfamily domain-containing protein [Trichoderma austrokoningii]
MGAGKPYPQHLSDKDNYIVEFDGPSDPTHPQNWWGIVLIIASTTFITTFGSGIFPPAISTILETYHIAPEVATLGITLYVLGFSAGPLLWGPLSEIKGRRLPLVIAAFGSAIFQFAVAVSRDVQSIMINRFFAGFFGIAPLAVGGGVFVDLFDNKTRGIAVTWFTICVFIGPMCAPFIGGFIVTSHLGWRWTQYLTGIFASAAAVLNLLFVRETNAPFILAKKAAKLRRHTKNYAIYAKQEETEVNLGEMVERYFMRPFRMLLVESIVLLIRYVYDFYIRLLSKANISSLALRTPGLCGLGISMVFLQAFNYIINAYLMFAASALAANTFLRSAFGAICPLFATYMFKGMGIQWAMTLLGCVAAVLAPVPAIFYFKGVQIRENSKYTPKFPSPAPVAVAKVEKEEV